MIQTKALVARNSVPMGQNRLKVLHANLEVRARFSTSSKILWKKLSTMTPKKLLSILPEVHVYRKLWSLGCRRAQRPEMESSYLLVQGPLCHFHKLPQGRSAKMSSEYVGWVCSFRRATR